MFLSRLIEHYLLFVQKKLWLSTHTQLRMKMNSALRRMTWSYFWHVRKTLGGEGN